MLDFVKALSDVNALAVVVAALAAFAVGSVWYSPVLFSKPWMKELGLKKDFMSDEGAKKDLPKLLAVDMVLTVMLSLGLAMLLNLLAVSGLWHGVAVGAFVIVFFSAMTTGINYVFEKRSFKLFAINAGYALVMGVIIGGILGVWPR